MSLYVTLNILTRLEKGDNSPRGWGGWVGVGWVGGGWGGCGGGTKKDELVDPLHRTMFGTHYLQACTIDSMTGKTSTIPMYVTFNRTFG